ncbi:uncharacterized protein LOC122505037 [Leptopilina heterotoma]|uniref:uncharacterized protein LOC122505037 n=1 Tax=Leptopilina heterotoma TaxID=63436 RepID=UPI001CA80DD3|nr:uncharacterized protein LOC122505037 [Leptopilina heterotoma]
MSTDNARNVIAAIKLLPTWTQIRSFAHTLDLVVNSAKAENKCKKIVGKVNKSDSIKKKLDEAQKIMGEKRPLKLLQLTETRWNSEFLMIERIVKLKIPLSSIMENKSLKF